MGWTYEPAKFYTASGKIDKKRILDAMWADDDRHTVLKSSMVGSTYYAAIKTNATGEVWATVVLTRADSKDDSNFGYKEMSEHMGPYCHNCPATILDLLTAIESKYALEWRTACRQMIANKKSPLAFKNLRVGASVLWTVPHDRFTRLSQGDKIVLTKGRTPAGRLTWLSIAGGWRINPKDVQLCDCEPIIH